MVVINIAAGKQAHLSTGSVVADLIAVCDAELLFIIRCNEPDASFSLLHVPVQPLPQIAITDNVICALTGVQPEHIGVMIRICTETVFPVISETGFRGSTAKGKQRTPILEYRSVLIIFPQGLYHFLKLMLKIRGFQIRTMVIPTGVEVLVVTAKIGTQMTNTAGLHDELLRLGVAVHTLRFSHGAQCHFSFHYRSNPLSFSFRDDKGGMAPMDAR